MKALGAALLLLVPPKLRPAAKTVAPLVASVIAILILWAVTGTYDKVELTASLFALGKAILTYVVPNLYKPRSQVDAVRTGGRL